MSGGSSRPEASGATASALYFPAGTTFIAFWCAAESSSVAYQTPFMCWPENHFSSWPPRPITERRVASHRAPASAPQPDAVWGLDFARDEDATAGFLRLLRFADRCWCWAYLVGPTIGLVVVRDPDVAPPRRTELLDVRSDGLWMELVCETPGEHWTYGVEAFAVRLDDPEDALHGEIGERLPMGVDLGWETDGSGSTGPVPGELLVGNERIELDAHGVLRNATAPDTAWPLQLPSAPFETLSTVLVPLGREATALGPVLRRVLARTHDDVRGTRVGWLEVLQSGSPAAEGDT